MRISFAATNPCHLFPLAKEFHREGTLQTYFSGYPRWKLKAPRAMSIRSFPFRTLITYSLLRIPHRFRPKDRSLFRWQDKNFDKRASSALAEADAVHGIPGQCEQIFKRARAMGIPTVMNHATGPTRHLVEVLKPEFDRVSLEMETETAYDDGYLAREEREYTLADYHCVASSVVRDQLIAETNISPDRIWVVPYGADRSIFYPPKDVVQNGIFRIAFAGQLSLRKGIRCLLDALETIDSPNVQLDCFGSVSPEVGNDIANYSGTPAIKFHGPVSQTRLADAFRNSSVLVLPSIEEGFGLVVPQALSCGLPCIVSDAVGASDLIRHRENGSIFPSGDSLKLASELTHWQQHPTRSEDVHSWADSAQLLLSAHRKITP